MELGVPKLPKSPSMPGMVPVKFSDQKFSKRGRALEKEKLQEDCHIGDYEKQKKTDPDHYLKDLAPATGD